jgi:hypothetical protein
VGERDLAQFDEFNASYEQQFPSRVKPVRTTVGCDLLAGMRVEVTVVARRPGRAASAVTPRAESYDDPDLVAYDSGIDGGGASAEEAAVHVVDEEPGEES